MRVFLRGSYMSVMEVWGKFSTLVEGDDAKQLQNCIFRVITHVARGKCVAFNFPIEPKSLVSKQKAMKDGHCWGAIYLPHTHFLHSTAAQYIFMFETMTIRSRTTWDMRAKWEDRNPFDSWFSVLDNHTNSIRSWWWWQLDANNWHVWHLLRPSSYHSHSSEWAIQFVTESVWYSSDLPNQS